MSAKISKLGTAQLRKAIDGGKFTGAELETAKAALLKRESKTAKPEPKKAERAPAKEVAKKAPVKKATPALPAAKAKAEKAKVVPIKKEKVVKEKVDKTIKDYQKDGVSGLVRKMLMPKAGSTVAGCSYGEANKAVQEKFERTLYASEFDRNFTVLKNLGILTEKQPPRFKNIQK